MEHEEQRCSAHTRLSTQRGVTAKQLMYHVGSKINVGSKTCARCFGPDPYTVVDPESVSSCLIQLRNHLTLAKRSMKRLLIRGRCKGTSHLNKIKVW